MGKVYCRSWRCREHSEGSLSCILLEMTRHAYETSRMMNMTTDSSRSMAERAVVGGRYGDDG